MKVAELLESLEGVDHTSALALRLVQNLKSKGERVWYNGPAVSFDTRQLGLTVGRIINIDRDCDRFTVKSGANHWQVGANSVLSKLPITHVTFDLQERDDGDYTLVGKFVEQ